MLAGDENYAFHQGDAGIMGELGDNRENKEKENKKRDEPALEEKGDEQDAVKKEEGATDADEAESKSENAGATELQEVLESHEDPSKYTICAPQLLHLDTEGKPLWFNGWLLHNKFADKTKKRFAKFESYLIEPREIREPGAWQLAESNMCCLTTDADKKFEFSSKEMATLDMIMTRASEMGMGDQH